MNASLHARGMWRLARYALVVAMCITTLRSVDAAPRRSRSLALEQVQLDQARSDFSRAIEVSAAADQRIVDWNRQWWISTLLWIGGFVAAMLVFSEKGFFGFIALYCFWSAAGLFPNHSAVGRVISLLVGAFCALCVFAKADAATAEPAPAAAAPAPGRTMPSRKVKADPAGQFLADLSRSSRQVPRSP